jgi:hypothetical protein
MLDLVADWVSKEVMDVRKKPEKPVQLIGQAPACNNALQNSWSCNNLA